MVFSGCTNAPNSHCSHNGGGPFTTIAATPLIAEKPYISENNGKYTLNVPKVETRKVGITKGWKNSDQVDFSKVFVANEKTPVATINQHLSQGEHLVLQPGNYELTDSIAVSHPNQVVLGLGMATLISTTGKPCIVVDDVDGVRIAGVLLQAGATKSDSLIQWGLSVQPGNGANPGVMSDVFARVGGTNN